MNDRDRVLRTIRALMEKTVANGCPVEEALAAHAKAQALIDTYRVSNEELYGTGPGRRWQEPEPEPAEPKQQQAESEGAAEAAERANSHDTNDPDFRSSMTARLANALYRAFSVLAVVLARARRSPKFLKFSGAGALLIVGGIVWLFIVGGIAPFRVDAQHREALRRQQDQQQIQGEARKSADGVGSSGAAAGSAASPHAHSGWMIQIGAFDSEQGAREHLEAAKLKLPALASAEPFTEPVQKGDTTIYRARFSGLDQETALADCSKLRLSDVPCMALEDRSKRETAAPRRETAARGTAERGGVTSTTPPPNRAAQTTTPPPPQSSDQISQKPALGEVSAAGATAERDSARSDRQEIAGARAILLEQDSNDPQGKHFDGTVTWSTEKVSPGPGLAPELEVHGDIAIPERHVNVTLSLRHNTDKALPASHTIQLMFNLPPNFPGDGVSSMPGIFAKASEQATGTPLAGISVKVTDNYFLLGLSADPTLQQRNVQLLKDQKWLDIAIVYKNNVKAILAVERDARGDRAFSEAFSAWGEGGLPSAVSTAPGGLVMATSFDQRFAGAGREFDLGAISIPPVDHLPPHRVQAVVPWSPPANSAASSHSMYDKLFGPPSKNVQLSYAPPQGGSTSDDTRKYAVQLASEWNEADAQATYRALQGRYGSVLGDQQPRIVRIEQSNKGVYYRVMVGQFSTALEATQFCNSLKALGGSCIVQCDRC